MALLVASPAARAQELVPPDLAAGDGLGNAVAMDGDRALVGAWNAGGGRGAVFAFRREGGARRHGGAWRFAQELEPAAETWRLGSALAMDRGTALVAAPGAAGPDGAPGAGVVHVFALEDERWSERQVLRAADARAEDFFGYSVSVRGDLALVGAYADDDRGVDAGAAYVYERADGVWEPRAWLHAADARPGAFFGHSVALAVDGAGRALAAIGAHRDDERGERAGAVYVFEREAGAWRQAAKLTASSAAQRDRLGHSLSLSVGGDEVPRVLAGARFHGAGGAAFVFELRGGRWVEDAVLRAPGAEPDTQFGWAVKLRGDRALVGAPRAGPERAGAVHEYERGPRGWRHLRRVAGAEPGGELGSALDLAPEGEALVGAWRAGGTGAVRALELGGPPLAPLRARWSDHLLALLVGLLLPLGALFGQRATRPEEPLSERDRLASWLANSVVLWIVAGLAVGATLLAGRPLAAVGLRGPETTRPGLVLGLALALVLLYLLDLAWKLGSAARRARTRERWRTELAMMPERWRELPAFALLCLSAGACEELAFRGFLVPYLAGWTGASTAGWLAAISLAGLPFALAHLYQGAADAAKTFVVALLFGALYLVTGSLWLPMALHAGVDLASGVIGVRFREPAPTDRT